MSQKTTSNEPSRDELMDRKGRKTYKSFREVIQFWKGLPVQDPDFFQKTDHSYTGSVIVQTIIRGVDLTFDAPILEVGCGWGRILSRFSQFGFSNLAGMDITAELLRESRYRVRDARLVQGDARRLPFAAGQFRLTYAVRILQYFAFDQVVAILQELKRVTQPGGVVAVIQPNKWNPIRQMTYAGVLLSPRDIHRAYQMAGLQRLDTAFFGFCPPSLYVPSFERVCGTFPLLRYSGTYFAVRGLV